MDVYPKEVAEHYLKSTIGFTGELLEDTDITRGSKVLYYNNKEGQVTIYQPVKKEDGGIWVVHKSTNMQDKINATLQDNYKIMTNSGMGFRININEKTVEKVTKENKEILTQLKKLKIDISKYYGKNIDILMYEVTNQNAIYSFIYAFEGTDLIESCNLQTKEKGDEVRKILISLNINNNI